MRISRIAALTVLLGCASYACADITGIGRAKDGDSIEFTSVQVRLHGIDAPEHDQRCTNRRGRLYRCGQLAKEALARALKRRPVRCEEVSKDRYGRVLGRCRDQDNTDIAQALVLAGHAVAYRRYSNEYVGAEERARKNKAGMWQGDFVPPWEHRLNNKRRQLTASPAASGPSRPGCAIKGNVSSKGSRVYHVPGQRHYAKTRISVAKGERWFCSEADAQAAGWRRSRR